MSTKKSLVNDTIDNAMNLTEKSATVALDTVVKTANVTESLVQGVYVAGYNANVDALKVAKNYWDATSEIRQDWINLFSKTGEKFIKAAANMELPLQKEINDVAKNVISNVEETVQNLSKQAKAATK
ncbi:MAG: hypothetical protein ABIP06_08140 [Pyrinomonadaceae bacterium]